MSDAAFLLNSEEGRRRVVRLALALTCDTPLAPTDYERRLLEQFIRGELTLDQVIDLLDSARQ